MADDELTFIGYLPPKCGAFLMDSVLIRLSGGCFDYPTFLWQDAETKEYIRKPQGKLTPHHPLFRVPMKVEQASIALVGDSLRTENGNTLIIPHEGYCLMIKDNYSFWVYAAGQYKAQTLGVIITDEDSVFRIHTLTNDCDLKWSHIRGKTIYPPGFTCNGVKYSEGLEIFQNDKYVITYDIGKTKCNDCQIVSKYRCIPIEKYYSTTLPTIQELGISVDDFGVIQSGCNVLPLHNKRICSCSNVDQIVQVRIRGGDWSEFYIADTTWWPQGYFEITACVVNNVTYLISKDNVIGTMRRFSFAPTHRDYEISSLEGLVLNVHNVENFGSVFEIIQTHRDDYREIKIGFNLVKNYSMDMISHAVPAIFRPGGIMGELVFAFTEFDNYSDIRQDFSIYTMSEEKLDLNFTTCIKAIREFTPEEDRTYNGVSYDPQDTNGFCFHIHESLPGTIIIEDDEGGIATYQNTNPISRVKPALRAVEGADED